MEGDGSDATKLGHFKQKTIVTLKQQEDGHVEVAYEANVNIVGKLAVFGDRIMKRKAKEVEEQFTDNLRNKLAGIA
jgi:carbon monoxide dehydrogenase subunit G